MQQENQTNLPKEKDADLAASYDLVVAISNRGYSDDVMDVAREVGARGGTVVNARGTGSQTAQTFFGITIQPEKEMTLIIATNECRAKIIEAVVKKLGPGTDAHTIAFSVPISALAGITPS